MDKKTTIHDIRNRIAKFNQERDWEQYHKPKDLIMALQEELGELSRCYLWVSESEIKNIHKDPKKLKAIKEEMADVFIYLIALANNVGVDISTMINKKIDMNEQKYPVKDPKHINKLLRKT